MCQPANHTGSDLASQERRRHVDHTAAIELDRQPIPDRHDPATRAVADMESRITVGVQLVRRNSSDHLIPHCE